jgi:catechol 2,3-dioxygenase-like lactoylglutathione lyase family enzyme
MGGRQIDHVTLNLADGDVARAFYGACLHELGLAEAVDPHGRVEFGRDGRSDFGFYVGSPRTFFQRAHVAFVAASRSEVDRFHAAALAAGGAALDGPRERPEFGMYSAYVTDPAGNGVEVTYRLPL